MFGEAVCGAAALGLAVEVGLEIPVSEQARLDAYMSSRGEARDMKALVDSPFWSREYQDGRSSQAMAALIERLRGLRASGLAIGLFVFDLDAGEDMSRRDERMAARIVEHVRAHVGAVTMVLTGEVHAWTTQGAPWNPDLLPMGLHIERAGIDVRSLGRATPAGTAWICTTALAADCAALATGPTGTLASGRSTGIELLPERSSRGNDGMWATPSLTASPPAAVPVRGTTQ